MSCFPPDISRIFDKMDTKNNGKFQLSTVEEELEKIEPSDSDLKNIKTAKEFIRKYIKCATISDMGELILILEEKFSFKAKHIKILNNFYREEKTKSCIEEEGLTDDELNALDIDRDEEDISQEEKDAARAEAQEILKNGDPLEYIIETVQENHKGDRDAIEAQALAFAGQTTDVTDGLHIVMNGPSGSGKSHTNKSSVHLLPARWKRETSVSPKALYYMGIKPGMVLFADDTEVPKELEETVKRSVTNFQQETHHITVYNGESISLTIPPRLIWLFTNVESVGGAQLLNRQLTFNTENTAEVKDKALAKRLQDAADGINRNIAVTHRVLVCRNMYGMIKDNFFKVKIPFASRIKPRDNSDLRIINKFIDMIVGYTIFKHQQRKTDEEGFLLAEEEDFFRAKRLFEAQKKGLVTKLNDNERKILIAINQSKDGADLNTISRLTGIPYKTAAQIINGRKDRADEGLLGKTKGLEVDQVLNKKLYRLTDLNILELYESDFITLEP